MFKPCNKYILIERTTKTEKEESLIALPEGVFKPENTHEQVKILAVSGDVRPPISPGKEAIVLTHMIEEVNVNNTTHYIVLANHVLGITGGETNDNYQ